jgi:pyruvate, orthophosphate dikinase
MNSIEQNYNFSLMNSTDSAPVVAGSKANTLLFLSKHKIPVPETIFISNGGWEKNIPTSFEETSVNFEDAISALETQTGRKFGGKTNPLLLAVRNASRSSAALLKYALLNFGLPLKDEIIINGYSVPEASRLYLREHLANMLREKSGFDFTSELSVSDFRKSAINFLANMIHNGQDLPRLKRKIGDGITPIFLLQAMRPSGLIPSDISGTIYSQDPNGFTQKPIGYFRKAKSDIFKFDNSPIEFLKTSHPAQFEELAILSSKIQQLFGTICKINFGIDDNKVYILSVHKALVKPEVESNLIDSYIKDNVLTSQEVIQTISSEALILNQTSQLLNLKDLKLLGTGNSLGNKVSTGRVATNSSTFLELIKRNEPVIFVSQEMLPSDVPLLMQSQGLLTVRGGITSHVAVVMRGLNKACISGVPSMAIMSDKKGIQIANQIIDEGEWTTLDESTKTIYLGKGEINLLRESRLLEDIAYSTDDFRNAKVLVNADTVEQVERSVSAGAEGVGLVRSEHQMLTEEMLLAFRCLLVSESESQRKKFIEIITTSFKTQLARMLEVLEGRPLHYRLLDAPINEFIPDSSDEEAFQELEKVLNLSAAQTREKFASLRETNNLLGCRGSRWGIANTDFYKFQIETAIQAATKVAASSNGKPVAITLIVPMINTANELKFWSNIFRQILGRSPSPANLDVNLGAMVETPKAALNTANLAKYVDTICLGTNDMTQCIWGLSRDDASNFFPQFLNMGLTKFDPFQTLDKTGVGELLKLAIRNARKANPKMQIYVCGEHASDPKSVEHFIKLGVNGISCNLNLITGLKVVVAQAELKHQNTNYEKRLPIRSNANRQASRALKKIINEVNLSNYSSAQQIALDWANEISAYIGIPRSLVWKYFKRNIVEKWFGSWEYKRFYSGWLTQDAVDYVLSHEDRIIRYSVFPTDIACHAVSKALPKNASAEKLTEEFEALDHSVPVEVFPQQPADHLCFRGFLHNNEFRFEAGIGQAMYTFEQERGLHPIVTGCLELSTRQPKVIKQQTGEPRIKIIEDNLYFLLSLYGESLLMKCLDLSNSLGVDWLAIEGYYNYFNQSPPFVCDIDLPQDIAFHCS